jgi:adenosylhomocysteine nucleosidase
MASRIRAKGPLGPLAPEPVSFLLCFAVKEEAKFLDEARDHLTPPAKHAGPIQLWITGMGRKNAAESIREAVAAVQPECVLTCGFAGGLNPALALGSVLFDEDFDAGVGATLTALGATSARFHCARRVAITRQEKRELWETTGADAVEMESSVIRTLCREWKIPSATVRVISDTASDDLPLDFNALMTSDDRIHYGKLALAVLSSPRRIPQLMTFQRQTITAARALGRVLNELLEARLRA